MRATRIDEEKFLEHFNSDTSKSALNLDLQFAQRLATRTFPAYLIEYDGEGSLIQDLMDYEVFAATIKKLTKDKIKPQIIEKSLKNLRYLMSKHPLISPIEIREAFDLKNLNEVERFIAPLVESKEILIENECPSWIFHKN